MAKCQILICYGNSSSIFIFGRPSGAYNFLWSRMSEGYGPLRHSHHYYFHTRKYCICVAFFFLCFLFFCNEKSNYYRFILINSSAGNWLTTSKIFTRNSRFENGHAWMTLFIHFYESEDAFVFFFFFVVFRHLN